MIAQIGPVRFEFPAKGTSDLKQRGEGEERKREGEESYL